MHLIAAAAVSSTFAAPTAGASAATASKPTVYWLEQGAGNPYWTAQHSAAAIAAKQLGMNFKVFGVANETPSDQSSMLEQEADQKPSLIMVNSLDPATLVPAIKYAGEQRGPCALAVLCDT